MFPEVNAFHRHQARELRIRIIIRDFMGKAPRAKGIDHRKMMVGWAVLSHKLWVLARFERAEAREEIEVQVPKAA